MKLGFWLGEKRFGYFGYRVRDLAVPSRLPRTWRCLPPPDLGILGPGEVPGDRHVNKAPWRTSIIGWKFLFQVSILWEGVFSKLEVCFHLGHGQTNSNLEAKHASSIPLDSVTMVASLGAIPQAWKSDSLINSTVPPPEAGRSGLPCVLPFS